MHKSGRNPVFVLCGGPGKGVSMTNDMAEKTIAVVIVAAGRGERAARPAPKQYAVLAGKTVLERVVSVFQKALPKAVVQIVIGESDLPDYREAVAGLQPLPEPVVGGSTRQQSVLRGLQALQRKSPDIVLIHDAARPFVSPGLIRRIIEHVDADVD